jgi:hypothetical protein
MLAQIGPAESYKRVIPRLTNANLISHFRKFAHGLQHIRDAVSNMRTQSKAYQDQEAFNRRLRLEFMQGKMPEEEWASVIEKRFFENKKVEAQLNSYIPFLRTYVEELRRLRPDVQDGKAIREARTYNALIAADNRLKEKLDMLHKIFMAKVVVSGCWV